jgi:hypothetical protein
MEQVPDFTQFLEHLFEGFDFDFGSLFSLILSLIGPIFGGGGGTA